MALKTIGAFLNSHEGGTLIIGVDDKGEPVGLKPDNFPSEDKMGLHLRNLINDRIGIEHAPYVISTFESFRDERTLRIECRPSHYAAYVKKGNTDVLYVRGGNATAEMPPSKIAAFLKSRFSE